MGLAPQPIKRQIQCSKRWPKPIHTKRAPDSSSKCTAPSIRGVQWTLSKANPNTCNNLWAKPCRWCLGSRWTKQFSTCRPQCKQWIMLIICRHFSQDKELFSRPKATCQECHNRRLVCKWLSLPIWLPRLVSKFLSQLSSYSSLTLTKMVLYTSLDLWARRSFGRTHTP